MTIRSLTLIFSLGSWSCLALAQSVVEDSPEVRRAYEQTALTEHGNPEAGKKLFFEDLRTKCSVCHRIGEEGGTVGPDMSQIGGKFDRPHLIESILEPSRQIVEGFRSTSFLTTAGVVIQGIVKERSSNQVQLLDANGKSQRLSCDDIEQEKSDSASIMPSGIAHGLSQAEFTDLIAYLETLRGAEGKFGAGTSGPLRVPEGFKVTTIATGISGAVAMETLPDGRVLLCEQTGALRVVRDGKLLEKPFATFSVDSHWERGLIGVTIDPNFQQNAFVYVCYVAKEPYTHHVVSRLIADGDVARPGTEQILLEGDDQGALGGNVPGGHQGGALHFGPDGCLYIGIGEQTNGPASQRLDTFQGKILRIHADGSIPKDNPLLEQTRGKYQAIWAYGLRNPFTFAIHTSGDMLINDVGGNFEEVNRGVAGGNYGWPTVEHGPTGYGKFIDPIHTYPQASISGGAFVPVSSKWPLEFVEKYLFADFVHGWIHYLDPAVAHATKASDPGSFASGFRRPVDMRFDSSGTLYVLLRNAWVIDNKFQTGTGSLLSVTKR
jgi:putative heme-binding domain-containing protein